MIKLRWMKITMIIFLALIRYIYAQSIPLIGHTASKAISKFCNGDFDTFVKYMAENPSVFSEIDGIGSEMIKSLRKWWNDNCSEFVDFGINEMASISCSCKT